MKQTPTKEPLKDANHEVNKSWSQTTNVKLHGVYTVATNANGRISNDAVRIFYKMNVNNATAQWTIQRLPRNLDHSLLAQLKKERLVRLNLLLQL